MSVPELILRIIFAGLGAGLIMVLLYCEVTLKDTTLGETIWIVVGIVAVLFVLAALIGPTVFARMLTGS